MYNLADIETIFDNISKDFETICYSLPFNITTFNDLDDIVFCPDGVHIVNMLGSTNMFEDDQHFRDYIYNLDPAEQGRFEYNLKNNRYTKMYMSFIYNGNMDTETAEPFQSYKEYKNFCEKLSNIYKFIDFLIDNGLEDKLDGDIAFLLLNKKKFLNIFIEKNKVILENSLKNKQNTTKRKVNKV